MKRKVFEVSYGIVVVGAQEAGVTATTFVGSLYRGTGSDKRAKEMNGWDEVDRHATKKSMEVEVHGPWIIFAARRRPRLFRTNNHYHHNARDIAAVLLAITLQSNNRR